MRAQERLATIGRTAAVLAHEFGHALNGTSMAIDILRQELADDKEPSQDVIFSLRAVSNEINRLVSLVHNFRSIARPQHIELKPTDLAGLAKEVMALEGSSYVSQAINVTLDCPSDLPRITAHSERKTRGLLAIALREKNRGKSHD